MKKVLHVIPSVGPLRGGPSVMVRQLAASLVNAGIETHVATTNDNGPGLLSVRLHLPVNEGGVTYRYFPRQVRFYTLSWPLASWLSDHVADYDVVHVHALFSFSTSVAAHCAHRRGVPYIVRPLGTLNTWGMTERRPWLKRASFSLLESRVVKHAALMHYTSDEERLEAAALTRGAASVVIPNAVAEAGAVERGAFRARLGVSPDRPIVLFLSRLDEKKGLDLLIQAFSIFRTRLPNALLVIAGNGSPEFVERLKSQAEDLGLSEDTLVWAGFIAGDEKRAALADADVFVLPSYSENFGIAVAEAMAAGLPVVVSDRVGIHADITAAGAGLVVLCDAAAVADALARLLSDRTIATATGQRGADLVRRRYSTAAVTAQVIDAYNTVVGGAARTATRASQLGAIQRHA